MLKSAINKISAITICISILLILSSATYIKVYDFYNLCWNRSTFVGLQCNSHMSSRYEPFLNIDIQELW